MGGVQRHIAACCLFVVALAASAAPAAGQRLSIGLEGGGTSVDDRHGLQPGFGVTLLWPMGNYFAGSLSYVQWFPGGPEPDPTIRGVIGERGLTLTALLRTAQTERVLWLIGGGFGQYEREVRNEDAVGQNWDAALTLGTYFMVRLTDRTALYLKGELSTPTGEFDATWGTAHLGLALPLF